MEFENTRWRSLCPVARTLDLVGDRWTLLVVRDLLHGKTHFDQFLESPEGIATNILTQRLRQLEEWGLIERRKDLADARRFAYRLTEEGEKLRQLVRVIAMWGQKHFPDSETTLDESGGS